MKTLVLVGLIAGTAFAQGSVVHVLEQREAKAGRFEVSLYPAAVQLNGEFTQHVGTFGAVTWHVREAFAFQLLGGGNWHSVESTFNASLVENYRVEAQAASSLLWTWGVFGGVEVEPLVAKFTILNGPLVHFGVVLGGGAGAGGTRHQLKPQAATAATYGDTGARFMGTFAAGFRLALGSHFTARLEVRDVAYAARIETVNGCRAPELEVLSGRGPGEPPSSQCLGFPGQTDAALARNLVASPGSAVLHNVGLYFGAGFIF